MDLSEVVRAWFLQPVLDKLGEMEKTMADTSQVLNEVAEKIRGPLYTSVAALIAENEELRGEDAAESEAAENVRAAVAELGAVFAPTDLPDVPVDLPPVDDAPADV